MWGRIVKWEGFGSDVAAVEMEKCAATVLGDKSGGLSGTNVVRISVVGEKLGDLAYGVAVVDGKDGRHVLQ